MSLADHIYTRTTTTQTAMLVFCVLAMIINFAAQQDYKNNVSDSEYYSRKYNKTYMNCWVITIDPISFVKDAEQKREQFVQLLLTYFEKLNINDKCNYICVMQQSKGCGLHAHFCVEYTFSENQIAM